ncbi:hypothetical protein [Isoptericola sp. NPDC056134]|uniref:hypothetical protein n=1 Tax=Isoptericola sp. NPDC056134 TaxID=3345723 RepID=UPI0035ECC06A
MSDAWHDMRAEERFERRRQRGDFRTDPPATDIHQHEPTPADNYHPDLLAYTDGGGFGKNQEKD